MYIPQHFQCEDRDRIFSFLESNAFAAIVSEYQGRSFATHVPLLADQERNVIWGHLAKSNPHAEVLRGQDVLCIFNGPHAYLSPDWYVNEQHVPTWNYVAIHVYGTAKVVSDVAVTDEILRKTTEVFEKQNGTSWSYKSDDAFIEKLTRAIVGVEIAISSIEAKVKMSQNRSVEDARGASAGLKSVGADGVAKLVDEFCNLE